jgi:hypothetical protein
MSIQPSNGGRDGNKPRERGIPKQVTSLENSRNEVEGPNAAESKSKKDSSDKKTFGRTPDGIGELALLL